MAAVLATPRHEIVLCARRPLAELEVELLGHVVRPAWHVVTAPAELPSVDWVLVTTKAYDAAGAAAWLRSRGAVDATWAILQNGVEHRERFAPLVDPAQLMPVMVDCPAERAEPGRVRQRGPGRLTVADEARGREFAELFEGTAIAVTLTTDLKTVLWRKLCTNAAGVLSALLLKPAGIMRDDAIAEVARGIVRECIAVGRAEGARLDDAVVEEVVAAYRAAPADAVNSLQADRAAGRPTEIDARNGVIVRLGRRHGIPTPLNEMAVALIAAAG